jgi:hypothetical protein
MQMYNREHVDPIQNLGLHPVDFNFQLALPLTTPIVHNLFEDQ